MFYLDLLCRFYRLLDQAFFELLRALKSAFFVVEVFLQQVVALLGLDH